LIYPNTVLRGRTTYLSGHSFAPNTVYRLSVDVGSFGSPAAPATTLTSDLDGDFLAVYTLPADVPYSTTSVVVQVTAPDNTTVDATLAIEPPQLQPDHMKPVCGGQQITARGIGFADGTYTADAPGFTFPANPVAAADGTLALSARLDPALPARTTVTVTSVEHPQTSFSYVWDRDKSTAMAQLNPTGLRSTYFRASCLTPGETVTFHPLSSRDIAPAAVHADATGTATFAVGFIAVADRTPAPGVTFTGASSHQSGTAVTPVIAGTTLAAGKSMSGDTLLFSPRPPGYVAVSRCNLGISEYFADGTSTITWHAVPRNSATGCHLLLHANDGNLVLYNAAGHGIWSTDTAGTGTHNRLIMRDDGNLALYNDAGAPVWTSAVGVVRTPRAMGAGQSLLRGQSLVNGATRLILRTDGNLAVYRSGIAKWSTRTAGRGAVRLLLATTGELVLLTQAGHIVWSSHRNVGTGSPHLTALASGDVRVTDEYGNAVWRTGTN
jgi:hypothetical protein